MNVSPKPLNEADAGDFLPRSLPGQAADERSGSGVYCHDRIDDDRHLERRRSLPWCGSGMTSGIAPQIDDEITEPV
jgi:hypothetical protein